MAMVRAKRPLTGSQKAAAVLIALGSKDASRLLKFLDETEVEMIAHEIATLHQIPGEQVESIVGELRDQAGGQAGVVRGGIEFARELLREWSGSRQSDLVERLASASPTTPFGFLIDAEPAELVQHLQGEHPQAIALVLSYLPASQAAAVLAGLDERMRGEVAVRTAMMERVAPEIVRRVDETLRRRPASLSVASEVTQRGGVKELATILNNADRGTERAIMASLEAHDPALADQVRSMLFVFEDITKMTDRDVQEVLRAVDAATLALALKGVDGAVRDKVVGNLSERAKLSLQEEIDALGPVRVRDVEDAQSRVVEVVRRLDEEGKIAMRRDAEGGLID